MPWNNPFGRSKGQPATFDCSGNAGIVAAGDGLVLNGWIVTGSGSGIPGMRMGKMTNKNRKNERFGDIGMGNAVGGVGAGFAF